MSVIRFEKVVSALPGTLTPDTLYMVRVGAGFDFYVSDSTGSVAHQINGSAVNLPTTVTQAEAEAGTLTEERTFTPQRVAQAIAALAQGSSDILVYASYVAFPATGTVGKLYLAENSGSLYAWIGSSYVNLTELASHTHNINDVIGLQSNLDSKAALTGAAFSGDVSSTGVITATIGMVSNGDFFGYGQGYFDNVLTVNNHVNLPAGSSYLINGAQHTHVKANITDFNDADYATAAQGTKADSAVQPADLASYATTASLATVATSGSYNDLTNLPSLFDGAYGSLSGLPSLGTASPLNVAATGDAAANEIVKGNDTRLTDARTPAAHTHTKADITDFPSVISQAEAEAGAATTERLWTAQRVAQAIAALAAGGGGGGASVAISDTSPVFPSAGDLWIDSTQMVLYGYYTDADGSQWVSLSGPIGPKGLKGDQGNPGIQGSAGPVGNTAHATAMAIIFG